MLEAAKTAAREAGRLLLAASAGPLKVDELRRHDVKLEMDKRSERLIIDMLRARFPAHGFLSEECGAIAGQSEYRWVIDPLDGTVNYSRRIPLWGTSIALTRGEESVAGVIYDATRDEMFWAEQGGGAFLNGERIRVSERRALAEAMVGYGYSSKPAHIEEGLARARRLGAHCFKLRALGSAVLHQAYLACGRLDAFFERGLNLWDFAAGRLIVAEAGGTAEVRPLGEGAHDVIFSNGAVHEELLKAMLD